MKKLLGLLLLLTACAPSAEVRAQDMQRAKDWIKEWNPEAKTQCVDSLAALTGDYIGVECSVFITGFDPKLVICYHGSACHLK